MTKTNEASYIKTFHEVHISEDGEKWYCYQSGRVYEDSPVGRDSALQEMTTASKSDRFARVVHVEKRVKVLHVKQNEKILSRQMIDQLLASGRKAIEGIKGLMVNEGFFVGFGSDGVSHSPTRIIVSFNAAAILGKQPLRHSLDHPAWKQSRLDLMTAAFNQCADRLKEAGVKFVQRSEEIELLP
jgi:hypothetical protein